MIEITVMGIIENKIFPVFIFQWKITVKLFNSENHLYIKTNLNLKENSQLGICEFIFPEYCILIFQTARVLENKKRTKIQDHIFFDRI